MNHFSKCEKKLDARILVKLRRNYLSSFLKILFYIIYNLMVVFQIKVGGTVMMNLSQ